jgi:uncharacterized protein DUF4172
LHLSHGGEKFSPRRPRLGAIKHLGNDDRNQLTVEAMSTEALTTSEIEGEILDGQVFSPPFSGSSA